MDASFSAATPERQDSALGPYLRALRAHRLLVAAITALALLGALAYLQVRTAHYEATAEVLLSPLPSDDHTYLGLGLVHDSNDPSRTAQTAATLIDDPRAAILTAQRLDHGWTRARVQQAVSVQPQGQSNILAVTATADSGPLAAALANDFTQAALQVRRSDLARAIDLQITQVRTTHPLDTARLATLESLRGSQDPTLSISQLANTPTSPAGTAPWVVALLAVLAGFAVGSGAALLMELVNQRVREPEELLSIYPLPVLSRIPRLTPGQRRRAQGSGSMPAGVREAFRTLQVQIDNDADAGRVLLLTSATTGDGKTTCSINLALALVAAGHRVILMDFDLRKPDVNRALGLEGSRGLVSLLGSDRTLSDLLIPAPQLPPLSVAPAGTGEGDALLLGALARRLPEIMDEARDLADYVILDTAPLGEVSDALRILPYVDDVIVVARPGNTLRPSYELMRDLLERAGRFPLGLVVVGPPGRRQHSYYAYGQYSSGRTGRRFGLARASQS